LFGALAAGCCAKTGAAHLNEAASTAGGNAFRFKPNLTMSMSGFAEDQPI